MMDRLISWIRERLFAGKDAADDLRESGVRVRPPAERPAGANRARAPRREAPPKPDLRFDAELGGRIEDGGPGKNVLRRSKYLREDTGTHEALKIIDEALLEEPADDSGFDPYNTGQFDRSKNWSKARK